MSYYNQGRGVPVRGVRADLLGSAHEAGGRRRTAVMRGVGRRRGMEPRSTQTLDDFTKQYIKAGLWTSSDDTMQELSWRDLAPQTLDFMRRDAASFQERNLVTLERAYEETRYSYTPGNAGHDFWLTRNRHGAGFWDRGLGQVGEELSLAAKQWPEVELYVGDDGLVYAMGHEVWANERRRSSGLHQARDFAEPDDAMQHEARANGASYYLEAPDGGFWVYAPTSAGEWAREKIYFNRGKWHVSGETVYIKILPEDVKPIDGGINASERRPARMKLGIAGEDGQIEDKEAIADHLKAEGHGPEYIRMAIGDEAYAGWIKARGYSAAEAPVTKQGQHGTLYLYSIEYKDSHDPVSPVFDQRLWAYNLEHAEDKFYSAEDAEGWTIVSIARVGEGLSQHRAVKHRPRGSMESRRDAKFQRCVQHVKQQDSAVNPWAVCHATLGEAREAACEDCIGIHTHSNVGPEALRTVERLHGAGEGHGEVSPGLRSAIELVEEEYGYDPRGLRLDWGWSADLPNTDFVKMTFFNGEAFAARVGKDSWVIDQTSKRVIEKVKLYQSGKIPTAGEASQSIDFSQIKPGDRVTIVNRFGQEHSGKAVMRGPAGWVLNMGGPHGRPDIATPENFVRASRRGGGSEVGESGRRLQWTGDRTLTAPESPDRVFRIDSQKGDVSLGGPFVLTYGSSNPRHTRGFAGIFDSLSEAENFAQDMADGKVQPHGAKKIKYRRGMEASEMKLEWYNVYAPDPASHQPVVVGHVQANWIGNADKAAKDKFGPEAFAQHSGGHGYKYELGTPLYAKRENIRIQGQTAPAYKIKFRPEQVAGMVAMTIEDVGISNHAVNYSPDGTTVQFTPAQMKRFLDELRAYLRMDDLDDANRRDIAGAIEVVMAQINQGANEADEKVSHADREKLPTRAFALRKRRALLLTDKDGKLDIGHVKAAAGRLSMMKHLGHLKPGEWKEGHARIMAAGKKVGLKVKEVREAFNAKHEAKEGFAVATRSSEEVEQADAVRSIILKNPQDIYAFAAPSVRAMTQETFIVIPMDLHGSPLSPKPYMVAMGQRDRVQVDPGDVLRPVIESNAAAFVVCHQHPSGRPHPSDADAELTETIREAARVACPSVAFLDHCILGANEIYSFRDKKVHKIR